LYAISRYFRILCLRYGGCDRRVGTAKLLQMDRYR
jgi:hypothetical protein